jgi:tetratricopeptide (TPR) repeat protein
MNLSETFNHSNLTESLHEACAMGIPSEVRRLLMKNPDVDSTNWSSGFTPLLVCVSGTDGSNRQEIIELLHAAGALMNFKDSEKGLTPLQYTALRNKPLCAKTLLKCGADVHIKDINGATALHGAVYHRNVEVLKVLLEGGADPNMKDNFGNTPVSLSTQANSVSITALLSSFLKHNDTREDNNIKNEDFNGLKIDDKSISPITDIEALYEKGNILFIKQDFDGALKCFIQVLSCQPENANALLFLTVLHYIKKNDDLAIECYRKVRSMHPDAEVAWLNLGKIFRNMKKPDRALRYYVKAIEIMPEYSEVWNDIGCVLKLKGNIEKSLKCLIKSVTLKPDNLDAWYNLGQIFIDKHNLDNAIVAWKQAAQLGDSEAQQNLVHLGQKWDKQNPIDVNLALVMIKPDENEIKVEEIKSEFENNEEEEDLTKSELISKLEALASMNKGQIISPSQKVHFSTIVQDMNRVGAIRHGSREDWGINGRRCIFDVYSLPNGREILAGYPS